MTSWHNEIVKGVQRQFTAAAEAAERERRRRDAVIDFWRHTTDALKAFCVAVNRLLGKQSFNPVFVDQDNNYVCSITYLGPTKRLAGLSLDRDLRLVTITIPNQSEEFTLELCEDGTALAVHTNEKRFTPDELVEEFIRCLTQIEPGRKFQKPGRKIRLDDEEMREPREW